MKKAVTAEVKPRTGFEIKKLIEHNGGEFKKKAKLENPNKLDWVCVFEGQEIGRADVQGDCIKQAYAALGGD